MIYTTNLPSGNALNSDVLQNPIGSEHVKVLHPKEAEIQELFGKSVLTLDSSDPRPKMLYLMAESDELNSFPIRDSYRSIQEIINLEDAIIKHTENNPVAKADLTSIKNLQNQALNGNEEAVLLLKQLELSFNSNSNGIDQYFQKLNEDFDVRFKIIHSNEELCQETAAISKVDNFKSIIIHGHGYPTGITISSSEFLSQSDLYPGKLLSQSGGQLNYIIDDTCFSNIPKDTGIVLISCLTGESETSIASTISKLSKNIVYAPPSPIMSDGIEFSSDIPPIPTFFHKTYYGNVMIPTCKFSPDGSRDCGELDYRSLTIAALSSLIAVYCAYKFFKPNLRS